MHPAIDLYARHVNPGLVKLLGLLGYGRVFVRAQGVHVWDDQGRQYLDALAGFGTFNLGHNHPRIAKRIAAFVEEQPLSICHVGPSVAEAELAAELARRLPEALSVCLFACSGSEAVEAALKLARAATGRAGYLFCEGGFHGTNLGVLGLSADRRLRGPFEPVLPGGAAVPFGDLDALAHALRSREHAAFVVEPVLGEGGVRPAPPGYLRQARELCALNGTLFVLDEVQTGLGRTGRMFAFEHEGPTPDVLVLAKALGGGVVAISAAITSPDVHARAYGAMGRFDLHGTTMAGNALACAVARETLAVIDDEKLIANARARGEQMLHELSNRLKGHPLVREVRGCGLLVGIELGPTEANLLQRLAPWLVQAVSKGMFGQWVALRLLEAGILCQPCSQAWDVVRLEPPLTIREKDVMALSDAVAAVLEDYQGIGRLIADVTKRLGTQALDGFPFR